MLQCLVFEKNLDTPTPRIHFLLKIKTCVMQEEVKKIYKIGLMLFSLLDLAKVVV